MRIVDIRETAIPLKSTLANSSFDFSEMTTSVVAVITDVVRDGKPVVRLRVQFHRPLRLRRADARALHPAHPGRRAGRAARRRGGNLDPEKILACMMQREKAGGHSERSIAIGTIEVAVWDAVAKIAGQAAASAAGRALQRRQRRRQGVLLCRRRLVLAGPDHPRPAGRDAPPSRRRLHHGEDEGRRPAARRRRRAASRRCKSILPPATSSRSTPTASSPATRRSPMRRALAPFKLRWFEEPCDPLDFALLAEIAGVYDAAALDRREPVLDRRTSRTWCASAA